MRRTRAWGLACGLLVGSGLAPATWSIILIDTRTGEVAAASATCLTGFDLQANTPVLLAGVGAATAQSFVDSSGANRTFIRDGLLAATPLPEILAGLSLRDSGHQTRQYGIADVRGGTLTFSGTGAGGWAGGRTGRVGDVVYAVQGNVLTGAPVVDRAVEAIERTPGDLAAKLMASMEAARAMGGDGRCSCGNGNPEGCGSPPPSFTKSAHIAYMLIARAGDQWNCRAAYRTQTGAVDLVALDGDGDGKPDLFSGATGSPSGLLTLRNTSAAQASFADAVVTAGGGAIRGLAAGDFNGDGRADLVGAVTSTDRLVFLRGTGAGFVVAGASAVGRSPGYPVVADFNGDGRLDVATADAASSGVSILLGRGDGAFLPAVSIPLPAAPVGLTAGDFDGDGRVDLATAHASPRAVSVLGGDGAGGFGVSTLRTGLAFAPTTLLARDVSGDGRADLFVGGGSSVLEITDPADPASDRRFTVPTNVAAFDVADADADGKPDLFVASSVFGGSGTLSVYRGLGGGAFGAPSPAPMGFSATRLVVRDVDGDGDLDAVYLSAGTAVVMSNLAGPGVMPEFANAGCASGSGFMEFNIANRQASDPDPVLTLRAQFDAWRAGLAGVADAVTSAAEWSPRGEVPADGRARRTLRVELRDWRGLPVDGAWTLDASVAGVAAAVESVTQVGPGTFDVAVRAGRSCGTASFEVVARGPDRAVTLMPAPTLEHTTPADANDDGFVDFFDYDDFVARLEAGDATADADGDGAVTPADYDAFLRAFTQGC